MNKLFKDKFKLLFLILFAFFLFLFFLPVVLFVLKNFSIKNFLEVLSQKRVYSVIRNTMFMAFLSTLFSVIIGFFFFIFVSGGNFRYKKLFLSISRIPFVMPSLILVLSFIAIFGKNGIFKLSNLYSLKSVVILHSFYNFPLILHCLYTKYISLDFSQRDCALTLGANSFQAFISITLRYLMPTIISSSILVFMYCFSSFSIPILLSGGIKGATLETEIYRNFKILGNNQEGISYSIISFLILFCVSLLYKRFNDIDKSLELKKTKIIFKEKGFDYSIFSLIFSYVILFPFFRIFKNINNTSSITNFFSILSFVFKKNINAITISFLTGVLSTLIAVFLSFVLAEYSKRYSLKNMSLFSFVPLCFSKVFISSSFISLIGLNYFYSFLVLVLLHSFMMLPVVYKIIDSHISSLNTQKLNFPLTLGASQLQAVFLIDLPSSIKCLKQAFVIGFCMSLGEGTYSIMLSSGNFQTLSSVLFDYINKYNFNWATSIAVLIMITVVFSELFTSFKNKKSLSFIQVNI